ncbi:MFS transporter permease [Ureibacillus endophyticus]|uniref:MFS transporter permease n=1 Tax=Ureibacillus endophyticus TaxID=1978490 RepID=UPI001FE8E0F6|nr:MFS transporter permease [Lysinibacillus endophyticus]
MTFFFVGAGLAMLRLFINGMIGKIKGKRLGVKIAFFIGLLSVGLPFQNWFCTEVIFAMSKTFINPSVIVMVASVVLMTIVCGVIYEKVRVPYLEEIHVA